jgi:hypothetical protein
MQTLIHEVQKIEKSAYLQQANFSWREPSFLSISLAVRLTRKIIFYRSLQPKPTENLVKESPQVTAFLIPSVPRLKRLNHQPNSIRAPRIHQQQSIIPICEPNYARY